MILDNKVIAGNFRLVLNGKELGDDLITVINEVRVEEALNESSIFTINFKIGDFLKNIQKEEFVLDSFNIGDEIQISLGFEDMQRIIVGEIEAIEPTFQEPFLMEIRGYDRLHKLTSGIKSRSFKDMKDSDIASSIASEYKLKAQVDDSKVVYPHVFQSNKSDYDFLLERANLIGFEVLVDDKTLIFRKAQDDKTLGLSLEYDGDLQSFSINVRPVPKNTKITAKGWDVKAKEKIVHTIESGAPDDQVLSGGEMTDTVSNEVVLDISHAEILARARYNELLKNNITAEGKCCGNPDIRVGVTVDIKNLGSRFSGFYYITSTKHSLTDDGYSTTFKARKTTARKTGK